jgi:hypothetical protein
MFVMKKFEICLLDETQKWKGKEQEPQKILSLLFAAKQFFC